MSEEVREKAELCLDMAEQLTSQPDYGTEEKPEDLLERYETVFGDLCWGCAGSGEVAGVTGDSTSGGVAICPTCKGRGTK